MQRIHSVTNPERKAKALLYTFRSTFRKRLL